MVICFKMIPKELCVCVLIGPENKNLYSNDDHTKYKIKDVSCIFFIFMTKNYYIIHRMKLKVRQGSSSCSNKHAFAIAKLFWLTANWLFLTQS